MTTEPPDWAKGFTPGIKAFPGANLLKTLPMTPAQIKAFIQFLITAIVAQIAIAFGGVEILGWQPFEFLVEWGQNLQEQASDAYNQSVSATATANTANTNANTALGNFTSILSGLGLGTVGDWITDLLGTKSTANTASSNATTSLGNWTSWLSGGSWANIAASVADFLGTKSTANTASSNASTALSNAGTAISNVQGTLNAIFAGWGGAGTATTTDVQNAIADYQTRITALEGGGTLTQYTSNGTWTNPTPAAHNLVTVAVVNGGQGGAKGGAANAAFHGGAPGGRSGGMVIKDFYTDQIPSSVSMTIGSAGSGASATSTLGGSGGTTSFGALLSGTAGQGVYYKINGEVEPVVPPGDGGIGGSTDSTNGNYLTGDFGMAGALAPGGAPTATNGGNGTAAPAGDVSGGGGGAGGNGGTAATSTGGAGGFPGGGGGGGHSGTASNGNGANGAAGCIYVITV